MADVKWAYSFGGSSNTDVSGGALNNLANGAQSPVFYYQNLPARDLYAFVMLRLGAFQPLAEGSLMLRVFVYDASFSELGGSILYGTRAGGDVYTVDLAQGSGSQNIILPMVRLYPCHLGFSVINNSGVALSSVNRVFIQTYNESVA